MQDLAKKPKDEQKPETEAQKERRELEKCESLAEAETAFKLERSKAGAKTSLARFLPPLGWVLVSGPGQGKEKGILLTLLSSTCVV